FQSSDENLIHCLLPCRLQWPFNHSARRTMTVEFFLLLCAAYLLGSVSFAVLLARLRHQPDPRSFGSRHPGASTTLPPGHRRLALATLIGAVRWVAVSGMLVCT